MPLNSRKVCRCYPWNTDHLTDSPRLSSWLRFWNISGRSSQTLVLIGFIMCPAQFMLPHYNLIMTHSTQCHNGPTPPPSAPCPIYLLRTLHRGNRSLSSRMSGSQRPRVLGYGPVASRSLGLRVRIPPGHGCFSHVSVVCCQVEVFTSGWSLVQMSRTKCSMCECDREASIVRSWPTGGCRAVEENLYVSHAVHSTAIGFLTDFFHGLTRLLQKTQCLYRMARSRLTRFEFEYRAGAIACRGWREGER